MGCKPIVKVRFCDTRSQTSLSKSITIIISHAHIFFMQIQICNIKYLLCMPEPLQLWTPKSISIIISHAHIFFMQMQICNIKYLLCMPEPLQLWTPYHLWILDFSQQRPLWLWPVVNQRGMWRSGYHLPLAQSSVTVIVIIVSNRPKSTFSPVRSLSSNRFTIRATTYPCAVLEIYMNYQYKTSLICVITFSLLRSCQQHSSTSWRTNTVN